MDKPTSNHTYDDTTQESPLNIPNADDPMKAAEEQDPLVEEAAKEEEPVVNRDKDEFTDQHLKRPKIDPEIEDVANDKSEE